MSESIENVEDVDSGTTPEVGDQPIEQTAQVEEDKTPSEVEVLQKNLAEKAFKQREAERKARDLEDQVNQLKEAQMPKAPEVPALPDRYDFDSDEEFNRAVANRDEALAEKVRFEASQQVALDQQVQAQQQQLVQQQQALQETATAFYGNGQKVGIEEAELNTIVNTLNGFGINQDLGLHIMSDDQGALIAKYLTQNPMELDNLVRAPILDAVVRIATEIKPKAAGLTPKVTEAPDPQETVRGGTVSYAQRGPKGATFT